MHIAVLETHSQALPESWARPGNEASSAIVGLVW